MNFITRRAALICAAVSTTALAFPIAAAIRPLLAAPADPNLQWVRAMLNDGFVFYFKRKTWHDGALVDADPLELDNYGFRKTGPGVQDDTAAFLIALEHATAGARA